MKSSDELTRLQQEMKDRNKEERKEELLSRLQPEPRQVDPLTVKRTVCVSCNRRVARIGSPYCSRCTGKQVINQLRDTLPGGLVIKEVMPSDALNIMRMPKVPNNNICDVTGDHGAVQTSDIEEQDDRNITSSDSSGAVDSVGQYTDSISATPKINFTRSEAAKLLGISPTTLMRWERKEVIDRPIRIAHSNQCVYTQEMIEKAKEYMNATYQSPQTVELTPDKQLSLASRKQIKINRRMERAVATRLGSLGRFR